MSVTGRPGAPNASMPRSRSSNAKINRFAPITTKETDEKTGEIKLKGEIWTAKTKFGEKKIKAGKYVTILSIDGATAVVREIEKGENK